MRSRSQVRAVIGAISWNRSEMIGGMSGGRASWIRGSGF
jgi:hypothetical protein